MSSGGSSGIISAAVFDGTERKTREIRKIPPKSIQRHSDNFYRQLQVSDFATIFFSRMEAFTKMSLF
jgi:hypothetical protein